MSDETVRSGQDVVDTDAEADFLDYLAGLLRHCQANIRHIEAAFYRYLVGVFGVQIVLDCLGTGLLKVFRGDLDQVRDRSLTQSGKRSDSTDSRG